MDQLRRMLQEKGLQPSHQRLRILELLVERKNHPTILELYRELSAEMPTLSKTTVYNTLSAFIEKGLVSALPLRGQEMRYDHDTALHHHFFCRRCGAIHDIEIRCAYAGCDEIDGHAIEEVHGHFVGVCRACRNGSAAGKRARGKCREENQH